MRDLPAPIQGRPLAPSADGDADRLVELWLRGKSPNTVEAYRRDVREFLDHCVQPLHEIKLQHVWEWMDDLESRSFRPATRARKLASVKSLFSFGHRVGFLAFNVGAAVRLPHLPDLLAERILDEDQVARLLEATESPRDSMVLRLFYSSGARVSEIAALRWNGVQERRIRGEAPTGQVTLLGKGSKTRSVLLSRDTWVQLQDFRAQEAEAGFGNGDDAVFRSPRGSHVTRQTIWRIVKKAALAAGISEHVSPHWLRHAHASHALDRGAPAHLVKETLGHKSLATTSRYTHARPDDSSGRYLPV